VGSHDFSPVLEILTVWVTPAIAAALPEIDFIEEGDIGYA
jgi:hypothetical protein